MFRNLFKYNKSWNQSTHMGYATYLPKPPQKPEDDLIIAFLLAGLGTSCGYSLWVEKKKIYEQWEKNSRFLSSILTGLSLSGSAAYIIKYIRR